VSAGHRTGEPTASEDAEPPGRHEEAGTEDDGPLLTGVAGAADAGVWGAEWNDDRRGGRS
jgi:hypothetical protein